MSVKFVLVRHGESTWNAEKRYQGQADPPLSAQGRATAHALGGVLAMHVTAVASSDLLRARETAEALIAGQDGRGVVTDVRLRERDGGVWTGLPIAEIERRWPGARARIYRGEADAPPGGESSGDVAARVLAALDSLATVLPDTRVAVVTHKGVLTCLGLHLGAEWDDTQNLAFRTVVRDQDGFRPGPAFRPAGLPPWPRHLVVVDEVAELTTRSVGKDGRSERDAAIGRLCEIARLGRAVGVHLIVCTQRPDADAVPGQLKACLPGTVAFRVRNATNSRILIESDRAALLPPHPGRAVWSHGTDLEEVQAIYLDADDSRRQLEDRWGTQDGPLGTWTPNPGSAVADSHGEIVTSPAMRGGAKGFGGLASAPQPPEALADKGSVSEDVAPADWALLDAMEDEG